MSKKKIALFINGYCGEIVSQFLNGFWPGIQELSVDVYTFCAYPSYVMGEGEMLGELNIYNLPDLNDFDLAIIVGNGFDYANCFEKIHKRCLSVKIPFITTAIETAKGHFVSSDNVAGTAELAKYLVDEKHCKDIAFLAGTVDNADSNIRMETVRKVLESKGLQLSDKPTRLYYSNWEHTGAADFIDLLVKENDLPEAIVCANDELAMICCNVLEDYGYNVPDDVMITGFDNGEFSKLFDPSISSVDQHFDNVGLECARIAREIFAGNLDRQRVIVPSEFINSESTKGPYDEANNTIRRRAGRTTFLENSRVTIFERKVAAVERAILKSNSFNEIHQNLHVAYEEYGFAETNSFHVVLDEKYRANIIAMKSEFYPEGYSDSLDVVFSKERGVESDGFIMKRSELVPFDSSFEENRFFIFVPLHEYADTFGYMVLCDELKQINTKNDLRKYSERMSVAFGRLLQSLRLSDLNKKLLELSQTDSLTHVKNRNAYDQKEKEFDMMIADNPESLNFALGVFDINDLKKINDTFGHEFGDSYIMNSCLLLCQTYKHSPVYRIGGDEFVVILTGEDQRNKIELFNSMVKVMQELKIVDIPLQDKVSMAGGIAEYDPAEDKCFADVFNRADSIMYSNKLYIKSHPDYL